MSDSTTVGLGANGTTAQQLGTGTVQPTNTGIGTFQTTNTGTYTISPNYQDTVWTTANTDAWVEIGRRGVEIKKDADLLIGDRSMRAWMEQIETRLNILKPNKELEQEWQELHELGERYRQLEQQLLEKAKMWETLKK